jgi:hypothetical protein
LLNTHTNINTDHLTTHLNTKLDSKLEQKWTPLLVQLGFSLVTKTFQQCGANPYLDANSTKFNAKGDYYHNGLNLFIELKAAPLNSQQSIAGCIISLREQIHRHLDHNPYIFSKLNHLYTLDDKRARIANMDYGQLSAVLWNSEKRRDALNYAFNHSAAKQLITQNHILAGNSRSEIWFANSGKEKAMSVAAATSHGLHAKAVGIREINSILKSGDAKQFQGLLEDSFL